jgi:ankyrin repeat protein
MRHRLYILVLLAVVVWNNTFTQQEDTTNAGLTADEQLILAADAGDTTRVINLIKLGADVDAITADGVSSLMYATQNGNLAMMKLLISCGADPDKKPANGYTALITAIRNGEADLAEFLIRNGASVDLEDNDKMSPLMHAMAADSFYLPDMLLYYGAQVGKRRRDGVDALMQASWLGRYEIAGMLIDDGADVNAADNNGLTPLHYATSAGHQDMMELLIGEGAELEARTSSGMTPLSVAVAKGDYAAARLLIGSGAQVNSRISSSLNPLSLAEEGGRDSIAAMLINNGARVILWPWFNQVTFGGRLTFNGDDLFTGINFGFSDKKYNLWTSLGYDIRPKSIRVLEPSKGNNYFQYWERRHFISVSLDKAFLFPKKSRRFKGGFIAGLQESLTFGSYRGSNSGPEYRMIFIPRAGAVVQGKLLRFRLNYEFRDLQLKDISSNWCSFSIELLFNRKKGGLNQNSITGM